MTTSVGAQVEAIETNTSQRAGICWPTTGTEIEPEGVGTAGTTGVIAVRGRKSSREPRSGCTGSYDCPGPSNDTAARRRQVDEGHVDRSHAQRFRRRQAEIRHPEADSDESAWRSSRLNVIRRRKAADRGCGPRRRPSHAWRTWALAPSRPRRPDLETNLLVDVANRPSKAERGWPSNWRSRSTGRSDLSGRGISVLLSVR